jgi:hypothetical protein
MEGKIWALEKVWVYTHSKDVLHPKYGVQTIFVALIPLDDLSFSVG